MEKDFLTDVNTEGEPIDNFFTEESTEETDSTELDNQEKETTEESSTETKPEGEKPSQEGEPEKDNTLEEHTPFHKHPRWKELNEKNQSLIEENQSIKERLDEFEKNFTELKRSEQSEQIPQEFVALFGENEEAWKIWKQMRVKEQETLKSELLKDLKREQDAELAKQKAKEELVNKTQKYLNDQLDEIEAEHGKTDRNAILKVIADYGIVDVNTGQYNVKKAYELYKEINKKTDKRKEIADMSVSGNKEPNEDNVVTWDKIHKKPWGGF